MKESKLVVGYDPIYNFHKGYHGRIVESTNKSVNWCYSEVINDFEESVISKDTSVRKKYVSYGRMSISHNRAVDYLFSPHILIPEKYSGETSILMELEDFPWLFSDTYTDRSFSLDSNKIYLFEESLNNPHLKHVLWWSNTALQRFHLLCSEYNIPSDTRDRMISISSILYPCAPVVERTIKDTSRNRFVAVCNEKNFYRKGGDLILSVFGKLLKEGINNWNLTIVGEVPQDYLSDIPVNNVSVIPTQPLSEMQRVFSRSDCLLFPSRADTFGTVVIEALNTGCYIIASYGKAVFATNECLSCYPNSSLIDSLGNDGIFDILDYDLYFEEIKKLIIQPKQLSDITTPYSLDQMQKQILSLIR